jgi:Leucine-rich repeat (LRR) protein
VDGAGLVGAIPKSFSDLTALTYLNLGNNPDITKLTYFGNLKKLECVPCQCFKRILQ